MNQPIQNLDELKRLLLKEEIQAINALADDLALAQQEVKILKRELEQIKLGIGALRQEFDDIERFGDRVEPHLAHKIATLKLRFPEFFGYQIKEAVKKELVVSKEEFVETLYPMTGQLVNKFVRYQFDDFFSRVSRQFEQSFSAKWWRGRVKSWISGVSHGEVVVSQSIQPNIREVFIIHHLSGLLIASYSSSNMSDLDMVAGMLTAIKAFARDLFGKNVELDSIEYGEYHIFMLNFKTYYIATVLSGIVNPLFKSKLDAFFLAFSAEYLNYLPPEIDNILHDDISEKLSKSLSAFLQSQE